MSTLNVAFAPQIQAAAQRHGLDPKLLAAVAAQETGGPGANSGRNIVGDGGHGHGVFQIDDRWHSFASTPAAMDPQANADYAAGMISSLIKQNGGDVHAALSAYNAGSPRATGTTTTWGDGRTLGYADSVLRHYSQLGGAGATAAIASDGSTTTAPATLADAQADSQSAQLQTMMLQQLYSSSMSDTTSALTSSNNVAQADPEPKKPAQSSASIISGGADGSDS